MYASSSHITDDFCLILLIVVHDKEALDAEDCNKLRILIRFVAILVSIDLFVSSFVLYLFDFVMKDLLSTFA